MMPVLLLLFGLTALVMIAGLTWYWMSIQEKVKIEQARHGGSELARTVAALKERVAQIDSYINPTGYDIAALTYDVTDNDGNLIAKVPKWKQPGQRA